MENTITNEMLYKLEKKLRLEERSEATVEKYLRDAGQFQTWLGQRPLTKEHVAAWKTALVIQGRSPATINSKLSSLNALFRTIHKEWCRVKFLKVQRKVFRDRDRDLTRAEYLRLVETARSAGKERLVMILETICGCGIRVSELVYITVEAVRKGKALVRMKGKLRTILLPKKLCRKLDQYIRRAGITEGPVFTVKTGRPISRRQVWGEMKALCTAARVEPTKVFPHNLRHLFAVEYYRQDRDIVKLADLLGHSTIETTRIYLISTGEEHQKRLDSMRLVC